MSRYWRRTRNALQFLWPALHLGIALKRNSLIHRWRGNQGRTLAGWMKIRLHVEGQLLVAAHHRDGHDVAGGNEKRGVQYVFGLAHFRAADLREDVTGFGPAFRGRRSRHNISHFRARPPDWRRRLRNVDTDPAMVRFTETDKVAADFFRCVDRQSITSGIILQTANEDANDLAIQIQERRAGLSPLGWQIDA